MYIVTGATGFIGSALVWELNQRGIDDIICVDDFGSGNKWKNLAKRKFRDFIPKDEILVYLENSIEPQDIKAIFHIGACSSTTEMNMDFLLNNNYFYTQNLAIYCAENKIPFIYASSAATYGLGEKGYNDSTPSDELVPLNPYGYSKVLFDRWIEKSGFTNAWAGLKFFNVFGPQEYHKEDMASVVYKSFLQINEKGSISLFKSQNPQYEDGKQMRDFVYIKDVTRWIFEVYEKKATGILNMGYGEARTWLDLATNVFKNMEKPMNIHWIDIPAYIAKQYQYYTKADITRLLKKGVSQPEWPLEKAIQDYVGNYLMKEDAYL